MTDYTKLVEALLWCEFGWSARTCDNCEYSKTDCQLLLSDAAAAIEELQQIADHHEQSAKDYWKEACEYKAQLPKRGEWVHGKELSRAYVGNCCTGIVYEDFRCSACGVVIEECEKPKWNYCPNCGAKMGGTDASRPD